MRVEYVYPSGRRILLDSSKDNYLLPITARLEISDISAENIFIDSKAVPLKNGMISIGYNGEDRIIEFKDEKIRICSLKELQSEKFKIEYHEFENRLYGNFNVRYSIDENALFEAIEKDDKDTGINLCTFNRKIEDIRRDVLLENIHSDIKHLAAVFFHPKIHLKTGNEIRPVDTVSRIGHEAVKHLASHSEHWEARKANGLVPARLLARTLEDDYGIYENIVAKCLVDKLYKYALDKRDELSSILMQMPAEESLISMNSEQRSYFHAMKALLKGYSNYEIETVGKLLEDQIAQTDYIIYKLSECRGSVLYRELRNAKSIRGPLKPTNIFMMDKNYIYVYRLWELFNNAMGSTEYVKAEEVTDQYELYCQTMFLFAMRFINFYSERENPIVFSEGRLCDGKYGFMDWEIDFKETFIPSLGINGILADISKKIKHRVCIDGIEAPDPKDISKIDFVRLEGQFLVFSRKPDDSELGSFCDLVRNKAKGDRGKGKKMYGELKKAISESFIGFAHKVQRVLLVPLTFKFQDSSVNAKRCIDDLIVQLEGFIKEQEINACYFLSPFRPTDYSEKDNYSQVKTLLNYGYADNSPGTRDRNITFGLLPVTVNDVNSYRRFTKVLLIHMLETDDELEDCPICGAKLVYDGDNGYHCNLCEMEVFKTKCKTCSEEFTFTRYPLPKINTGKADTLNIKIMMDEVCEGFKGITALDISSKKPICPHCGKVLC